MALPWRGLQRQERARLDGKTLRPRAPEAEETQRKALVGFVRRLQEAEMSAVSQSPSASPSGSRPLPLAIERGSRPCCSPLRALSSKVLHREQKLGHEVFTDLDQGGATTPFSHGEHFTVRTYQVAGHEIVFEIIGGDFLLLGMSGGCCHHGSQCRQQERKKEVQGHQSATRDGAPWIPRLLCT